jgi:hypothetical protein
LSLDCRYRWEREEEGKGVVAEVVAGVLAAASKALAAAKALAAGAAGPAAEAAPG